jgi:hypothetical protein
MILEEESTTVSLASGLAANVAPAPRKSTPKISGTVLL